MPETLIASKQGQTKIKQAREEKGWTVDSYKWLEEASKVLDPNWPGGEYFAEGISYGTWRRFLTAKNPINAPAFKAYCQVLGLNWEEIVEKTPPQRSEQNQTAEVMWFLVLSGTINNEVDRQRAEAIVAHLQKILEDPFLKIQELKKGSVVLVLQGYQEGFEWAEYLFRTGELTELLGVPVLDVRLAPAPINWRQFLQNLFEPYWQQPEQLLPAGAHRSAKGSNALEAILNLIHLLQTSQDEPTRRQAAEALGKTGTGNPNAISALTQLLRNSQDPETLWQAALSLGKLDPGNPAAGVERAKAFDLGTQADRQAVALIAAFRPKTDGEVSIRLRVEPVEEGQIYLPPNLKLTVFDESGEAFIQAESTSRDNFLQRGFSGPPELQFSVTISLGDASITEEFLT
ncbi:DUF1822 family protein [Kamptonema formosum]|uniref:DUF1822 family protein n=1 Tax=Kamptonema formosum TaxID=331992 RepID=UPI00034A08F0|nr:DUF1822 family protein [Oscillatoria sp. PCC 10802]